MALNKSTARIIEPSIISPIAKTTAPAARSIYMSGLWNWLKKSRNLECGFSSGRMFAPYLLRRSFAMSSERPRSELSSFSNVFSNENECQEFVIVRIISEFHFYFSSLAFCFISIKNLVMYKITRLFCWSIISGIILIPLSPPCFLFF